MAEAGDCRRAASSRAAAPHSPADSLLVLVMAPALEDVVEEEDVFMPQNSTLKRGSEAGAVQEDSVSPVKQLESEFLPLTIRKQVSYRCPTGERTDTQVSYRRAHRYAGVLQASAPIRRCPTGERTDTQVSYRRAHRYAGVLQASAPIRRCPTGERTDTQVSYRRAHRQHKQVSYRRAHRQHKQVSYRRAHRQHSQPSAQILNYAKKEQEL
ncbi:hypothetical protein Q7C36_021306 [Tachysurus vachellii]|uniref:Uncharacterized protein n=1 Tax=Tachysurus vachellii TaxID=175792 RepID=A0AA88IMS8_TACVA|nr:hypothetical protein Q7C36_021306 [Tachysurus vachellii]